ncbi:MAG: hypothetical protein ACRDPY_26650, partial [Streptosporangiaceae bacterium]
MSVLYRDAALADGRSPQLSVGVSVLVADRRIAWIRPASDEGPLPGDCCRQAYRWRPATATNCSARRWPSSTTAPTSSS